MSVFGEREDEDEEEQEEEEEEEGDIFEYPEREEKDSTARIACISGTIWHLRFVCLHVWGSKYRIRGWRMDVNHMEFLTCSLESESPNFHVWGFCTKHTRDTILLTGNRVL
jgi:hypothetical protein